MVTSYGLTVSRYVSAEFLNKYVILVDVKSASHKNNDFGTNLYQH